LRILLVEDDEATAEILGKLLKSVGHNVSVAADCAAAREEAAVAGDPFQLLVCDIALPDGSGLELLAELKTRCERSIALTGYGTENDIQKSHAAGFDCHLTKPVTLGQLVEAIDRLFV
jgi:CheY-like chemotaxis protein